MKKRHNLAVVMLAQRYVTSGFVAIIASSTALWILLLDSLWFDACLLRLHLVAKCKPGLRGLSWIQLTGLIIILLGVMLIGCRRNY